MLSNKESSSGDMWISPVRGKRIDFPGELEAGVGGNRRIRQEVGATEVGSHGRDGWNVCVCGGIWESNVET